MKNKTGRIVMPKEFNEMCGKIRQLSKTEDS